MGSGGFFVQSEQFIKEHGGKLGNVSIYGQEYNHTTWQLGGFSERLYRVRKQKRGF
jgi:type I restriction enzyme M protein